MERPKPNTTHVSVYFAQVKAIIVLVSCIYNSVLLQGHFTQWLVVTICFGVLFLVLFLYADNNQTQLTCKLAQPYNVNFK